MTETGLFDQQSLPSTPESDRPISAARLYLARYNLLDCLSSGLIKAAELYRGKYRDPSLLAPHHALIFLRQIPQGSLGHLWDDDPQNFPIELEVDLPVGKPMWRITADYKALPATGTTETDIGVLIPFGLPVNALRRILFRTEEERAAFLDVQFGDIDVRAYPTGIAAKEFDATGDVTDVFSLEQCIQSVQTHRSIKPAYRAAIALIGGLLALDGILVDALDSPEWVAALLYPGFPEDQVTALLRRYSNKLAPSPELAGLSLLPEIASLIARDGSLNKVPSSISAPEALSKEDTLLVYAATAVLMRSSSDDSAVTVLENTVSEFRILSEQQRPEASPNTERYLAALKQILAVRRNEAELPSPLSRWPDIPGGLLLFAIRPEFDRVMTLAATADRNDYPERLIRWAVLFSGMLLGYEGFRLEYRNTQRTTWIQFLLIAFLERMVPVCYPDAAVVLGRKLHAKTLRTRSDTGTISFIDMDSGRELRVIPAETKIGQSAPATTNPPIVRDEVTLPQSESMKPVQTEMDVKLPDTLYKVSGEQSVSEEIPLDSELSAEASADAQQEQASLREAKSLSPAVLIAELLDVDQQPDKIQERWAIRISRRYQWHDCLRQRFVIDNIPFHLYRKNGSLIFELNEFVRPEIVIRWDQFRDRFRSADPSEVEELIRTLLERQEQI